MKAIIFDMDGVLIDSEPTYNKIEDTMVKEFGFNIDEDTRASMVGFQMGSTWKKLKNKFKIDKPIEDLIRIERSKYKRAMDNGEIEPIKGAYDLVKKVKEANYKTAIASSSYKNEIESACEIFGFGEFIDVIMSGEDVSKGKPNPDIFIKAANKLGVCQSDCIVIEDSKNGVMAAKEAGMKCIGFSDPKAFKQNIVLADLIVKQLNEISLEKLLNLFSNKS